MWQIKLYTLRCITASPILLLSLNRFYISKWWWLCSLSLSQMKIFRKMVISLSLFPISIFRKKGGCHVWLMEMLKNALTALVYKLFLEIFYKKMIKQLILLTILYISHKSNVKTFLIWFINKGHANEFP